MPKNSNQKLKILYLLEIFRRETNEEHPLTISQLIERLEANGIEAERKSLYDDFEALSAFGYEIQKAGSGKNTAYYLAEREFELPELKLLADAVACSKFITESKSRRLISKISALSDKYGAKEISRDVIVYDRVKTINEHIYYNVDVIQAAIKSGSKINFLYFDYDCKKKKRYHNGGARSEISPYALCWQEENYYVVGYYPKYGTVTNFRVDKMERAEISVDEKGKPIKAEPVPTGFNILEYTKKRFGMFTGEDITLKLKVHNSLSGVILDRFGKSVSLVPFDEEHFTLTQKVAESPVLLSWIFQFGEKIEIISPESLREKYKDTLDKQREIYRK